MVGHEIGAGVMRILVFGAGVIGSVYGGLLHEAGHDVSLFARGSRLAELQTSGLVLDDAQTGRRRIHHVPVVAELGGDENFDLVLVPVRREQFEGAVLLLTTAAEHADVLLFGNAAGMTSALANTLGPRALFGFPAAGGVRDGAVVRYVLIGQQKTMLAEPRGAISPPGSRPRRRIQQRRLLHEDQHRRRRVAAHSARRLCRADCLRALPN